jgi:hypothetical protein
MVSVLLDFIPLERNKKGDRVWHIMRHDYPFSVYFINFLPAATISSAVHFIYKTSIECGLQRDISPSTLFNFLVYILFK